MRISLALGALALASAACGGSGNKNPKNTDAGIDGGTVVIPDGGGSLPFQDCPRSSVPAYPHYDQARVWTAADAQACTAACGSSSDPQCFDKMCPNFDKFSACVDAEINACLTAQNDGPCRSQWETLLCCAAAFNCLDQSLTDTQAADCVQTNCSSYQDKYQSCGDKALSASSFDGRCLTEGTQACFLPESDGGTGVTDGGTSAKSRGAGTDLPPSFIQSLRARTKLPPLP